MWQNMKAMQTQLFRMKLEGQYDRTRNMQVY
jgi:hypothetical protein